MYSTSVNIKSIISEVSEAITEKLTDIINPIINEKNEVDRLLLNMPTIKDIIKKNVELERENKDLKNKLNTVRNNYKNLILQNPNIAYLNKNTSKNIHLEIEEITNAFDTVNKVDNLYINIDDDAIDLKDNTIQTDEYSESSNYGDDEDDEYLKNLFQKYRDNNSNTQKNISIIDSFSKENKDEILEQLQIALPDISFETINEDYELYKNKVMERAKKNYSIYNKKEIAEVCDNDVISSSAGLSGWYNSNLADTEKEDRNNNDKETDKITQKTTEEDEEVEVEEDEDDEEEEEVEEELEEEVEEDDEEEEEVEEEVEEDDEEDENDEEEDENDEEEDENDEEEDENDEEEDENDEEEEPLPVKEMMQIINRKDPDVKKKKKEEEKEVEEEEEEEEDDEDEISVVEVIIKGKIYYTDDEMNGDIYDDDDNIVGKYVNGNPKFSK